MQVAESAEPGSVILCMPPDTGERYLSSPLFEGIPEDMTEEEADLSRSTPRYHMPGRCTKHLMDADRLREALTYH